MNTWKTDLGHNWFLLKPDLNDGNRDGRAVIRQTIVCAACALFPCG